VASPALAVKAGRQRGPSVLDKRQEQHAGDGRGGGCSCEAQEDYQADGYSVATVVDPSLPAGVGIMGRGRSTVNARLTSDGTTVEALQRAGAGYLCFPRLSFVQCGLSWASCLLWFFSINYLRQKKWVCRDLGHVPHAVWPHSVDKLIIQ
jgi:hypothetical protein